MRIPSQVKPAPRRRERSSRTGVQPADFLDDVWSGFTSVMDPFVRIATPIACPLLCAGDKTCLQACRGGGDAIGNLLGGK